jgi:zinc finger CCCH domain-containing protein 13
MANRRYGDRERARERGPQEGWDPSHDRQQERRWTVVEERDGRSKRSSGRERRSGALVEDGKEKDDRRDRERDRDREREKEPAWMDTYIPNTSTGILGGTGGDGELDGIQAWKKDMKAKEQKDKGSTSHASDNTANDQSEVLETRKILSSPSLPQDKQLDEIQLFKLMMKREEEKKKAETSHQTVVDDSVSSTSSLPAMDNGVPGLMRIREQNKTSVVSGVSCLTSLLLSPFTEHPTPVDPTTSLGPPGLEAPRGLQTTSGGTLPHSSASPIPLQSSIATTSAQANVPQATSSQGSTSLLSILSSSTHSSDTLSVPLANPAAAEEVSSDRSKGSRLFPKPLSSESYSDKSIVESPPTSSPSLSQFNPPQGSRLLAFGARGPIGQAGKSPAPPGPSVSSQLPNGLQSHLPAPPASSDMSSFHNTTTPVRGQNPDPAFPHTSDAARTQQAFTFENTTRSSFVLEESPKSGHLLNSLHHQPGGHERPSNTFADLSSGHTDVGSPSNVFPMSNPTSPHEIANGGGGYAASKGSRFAKFFDGKAREGQPLPKSQGPVGYASSSPNSAQRQDSGVFTGTLGGSQETRAIDDIFAMLNSSAQVCDHLGTIVFTWVK